jgi:hypothetical protein
VLPPLKVQNCPPFVLSLEPIFIGKMLSRLQNWSLNSLFCKILIFLNIFVFFFKTSNINVNSMRKIKDFKTTRENLNSFLDDVENAKNDANI